MAGALDPIAASIDAEMQQPTGPQAPAQARAPSADPVAAQIDSEMEQHEFGTPEQTALAGVEGAAKGLLGPVATLTERALNKAGLEGLSPADQAGRERANPWTHGLAEVGSFTAGMLTGTGEAGLITKAGEKLAPAAEAIGIGGKGAGILSKIGSHAARGAVENALFQGGDEISRYINDPNSVQSALPHIGLAAMIGGGFGGLGGGVSSLWRATVGPKAAGLLNAIADKSGGIEGAIDEPVEKLVSKAGLDVAPELRAGLSDDPVVRDAFNTLVQSDTTNSGRAFQETLKDFKSQAGRSLSQSLGRDPEMIPEDFDKYSSGKNIGTTLADEVKARVDPLKDAYEGFSEKFAGKPLNPSLADKAEELSGSIDDLTAKVEKAQKKVALAEKAGDPARAIEASAQAESVNQELRMLQLSQKTPGTTDALSEKIGQLANDERWTLSPSSDIMHEVNRVQKELPNLKTLSDLTAYIERVGENTSKDLMNGPLRRAGMMLKKVLRESEGDLIADHLGASEGEEALAAYRSTQKAYAAESALKEELEGRLGKLGATSSYSERIREMSGSDGESLFRKLSGKDDADLLRVLQENFPRSADALRQAHLDQILSKARVEDGVDPYKVFKSLKQLSPQLRSFVVPEGSAARVEGLENVLERLKASNYNYSNTARTWDKLFQHVPGSAVGLVAMLTGHNPALSVVMGALTKYISKDAPDAVRLGLLKWIGSNRPIEAGAFKTMVDTIHGIMKGDDLMSRAAVAFFRGDTKVLPEHTFASARDTDDLDKKVKTVQTNTTPLERAGQLHSYYMPNHAIELTGTATRAAGYLNSIRPSTAKAAPLDPPREPSAAEKATYDRALTLAQQPLTLIQSLKDGQLTSEDVAHVKAMYPGFYSRLSQKLTEAMINHVSKGKEIPHEMRAGLSTLLDQPLDSSFFPQTVLSNQAVFVPAVAPAGGASRGKPSVQGMREIKKSSRLSLAHNDGDT